MTFGFLCPEQPNADKPQPKFTAETQRAKREKKYNNAQEKSG